MAFLLLLLAMIWFLQMAGSELNRKKPPRKRRYTCRWCKGPHKTESCDYFVFHRMPAQPIDPDNPPMEKADTLAKQSKPKASYRDNRGRNTGQGNRRQSGNRSGGGRSRSRRR